MITAFTTLELCPNSYWQHLPFKAGRGGIQGAWWLPKSPCSKHEISHERSVIPGNHNVRQVLSLSLLLLTVDAKTAAFDTDSVHAFFTTCGWWELTKSGEGVSFSEKKIAKRTHKTVHRQVATLLALSRANVGTQTAARQLNGLIPMRIVEVLTCYVPQEIKSDC